MAGQRGLAHAAGAKQRDEPLRAQHRVELGAVGVAADERRWRSRDCVDGVVTLPARGGIDLDGRRPSGLLRCGMRRRAVRRCGGVDGRREAVAASGHRGDGQRPEQLAQRQHVHLQVVLLDDEAGPDDLHQLVLGDDAVAPLDERDEEVEGAAAQLERLAFVPQRAFGRAQLEVVAEADDTVGAVCRVGVRGALPHEQGFL